MKKLVISIMVLILILSSCSLDVRRGVSDVRLSATFDEQKSLSTDQKNNNGITHIRFMVEGSGVNITSEYLEIGASYLIKGLKDGEYTFTAEAGCESGSVIYMVAQGSTKANITSDTKIQIEINQLTSGNSKVIIKPSITGGLDKITADNLSITVYPAAGGDSVYIEEFKNATIDFSSTYSLTLPYGRWLIEGSITLSSEDNSKLKAVMPVSIWPNNEKEIELVFIYTEEINDIGLSFTETIGKEIDAKDFSYVMEINNTDVNLEITLPPLFTAKGYYGSVYLNGEYYNKVSLKEKTEFNFKLDNDVMRGGNDFVVVIFDDTKTGVGTIYIPLTINSPELASPDITWSKTLADEGGTSTTPDIHFTCEWEEESEISMSVLGQKLEDGKMSATFTDPQVASFRWDENLGKGYIKPGAEGTTAFEIKYEDDDGAVYYSNGNVTVNGINIVYNGLTQSPGDAVNIQLKAGFFSNPDPVTHYVTLKDKVTGTTITDSKLFQKIMDGSYPSLNFSAEQFGWITGGDKWNVAWSFDESNKRIGITYSFKYAVSGTGVDFAIYGVNIGKYKMLISTLETVYER